MALALVPPMRILDIDNCIANDEWRIARIEWHHKHPMQRYRVYHELAPWDSAHNADLYADGEPCVLLTARPVLYRVQTIEWLKRAGVQVAHLIMRNNDDIRPSLDVKRSQLMWLPDHYGVSLTSITKAYDDRPEIVAMYEAHGIPAEVRAIHSTSAYDRHG